MCIIVSNDLENKGEKEHFFEQDIKGKVTVTPKQCLTQG